MPSLGVGAPVTAFLGSPPSGSEAAGHDWGFAELKFTESLRPQPTHRYSSLNPLHEDKWVGQALPSQPRKHGTAVSLQH